MEEEVDYGEIRRKIHEALLEAIANEEIEATMLSGWNLIFEGVHPNNKRSLTYITSDATGESPLTPWASRGYMKHIEGLLNETNTIEIEEEDEEDD